jgi:hypothetical protein
VPIILTPARDNRDTMSSVTWSFPRERTPSGQLILPPSVLPARLEAPAISTEDPILPDSLPGPSKRSRSTEHRLMTDNHANVRLSPS